MKIEVEDSYQECSRDRCINPVQARDLCEHHLAPPLTVIMQDVDKTDAVEDGKGVELWAPLGYVFDPPPDRRRFTAPISPTPWNVKFEEARGEPGRWVLFCLSSRSPGVTYRIREGSYGGAERGEFETTQRSFGSGFSAVWIKYVGTEETN